MAVGESREILTEMDNQDTRRSGVNCQMSKKATVFLGVFMCAAILGLSMVAYYATPSDQSNDQISLIKLNFRAAEESELRLPKAIKPTRYDLRLQPFVNGNFSIKGSVEIEIEVLEAISNVTLHISDIITKNETITLTPTDDLTGEGLNITDHLYDHEKNFYIAILDQDLEAGKSYVLFMEFEGYLNDQLVGFYRSQYTAADGTTRFLAVTQFEPTDARKAFPCFDEPEMKATFDISIARETTMTSISNMPVNFTESIPDQDGWVWDHFQRSVPMSTYLVAVAVTDFDSISSNYNDHVLFRVWARNEAIGQADYALQAGPAILTFYEEYYNVPFPLPKQDMIALPDFSAGAMENWGLITYRETYLLYEELKSSASSKGGVASVVAHELAHQWFGDLVTMKWWSDLWLNEGFANYMQYLGTDSFEPSWNVKDTTIFADVQYVMILDSLESSHPVSIPVSNPNEINQIFDGISYSKGSSLIRMMNNFVTEATFRQAITNYLTEHAYGNAEQDDLWAAMTAQAHADGTLPAEYDVKTIMDTWTLKKGYPVIDVKINGDGTATVSQERFLQNKNSNSSDLEDYTWWVPITWTSRQDPDFENTLPVAWMTDADTSIDIQGLPSSSDWVIFNIQETGFYRVNYEPSNWQLITEQLTEDHEVISLLNRAQILDDALDLARGGRLPYNIALETTVYLGNFTEREYVVFVSALENVEYLEEMFTRTPGYGAMKQYLLYLTVPQYTISGFDDSLNDTHTEQLSRALAVSWVCKLGFPSCVTNSVDLFSRWMADPVGQANLISPNLKSTVYCTAIAEGAELEWNFLWGIYKESNSASEKQIILRSLGCTRVIWLLESYLEAAFTEGSGIRKQDSGTVFSSVANNDIGRDIAWDYLQLNVEKIAAYYNTFSGVGDLVSVASSEFNTQPQLQELVQFKVDYAEVLGSATYSIDQSIERTENNIFWMDNYYQDIMQWLDEKDLTILP